MKNLWPALLAIVVLAALAYLVNLLPHASRTPIESQPTVTTGLPQFPQISTAGWKTYTSAKYGYSFKYPTDWELQGGDERAILVTPEDIAARKQCEKDNTANNTQEPCGPTQIGSEYFQVYRYDGAGYKEQVSDRLAALNIKTIATSLNSYEATFYIDPTVTERYYWDISQNDSVYNIAVITQAGALDMTQAIDQIQAAIQNQQIALAIANTFTLK